MDRGWKIGDCGIVNSRDCGLWILGLLDCGVRVRVCESEGYLNLTPPCESFTC